MYKNIFYVFILLILSKSLAFSNETNIGSSLVASNSSKNTPFQIINILHNNMLNEKQDNTNQKSIDAFDYTKLSQSALTNHWKKLTLKDRENVIEYFKRFFLQKYIQNIKNLSSNPKIILKKEEVKEDNSFVYASLTQKEIDVDIQYKLHKVINKWKIYDINIDGLSLLESYKSIFNQHVNKHSLKDLISTLSKRLSKS